MLDSAILRTLTNEDSCALRVHPHSVGMVWNKVRFAGKFRHPKAVVSIGREQLQERRCRMFTIAHGDVQFVGGDDPQLWISKLPPVLMSNRDYIHSARRFGNILDGMDDSGSGQEQDNDNQNRNDRPGQLNMRASVHLSRLAAGTHCSPMELNERVSQ